MALLPPRSVLLTCPSRAAHMPPVAQFGAAIRGRDACYIFGYHPEWHYERNTWTASAVGKFLVGDHITIVSQTCVRSCV